MSVPVVEQIARLIANRLATVNKGNGYTVTVKEVIRPKRRNDFAPTNGTTVLRLDSFESGEPEISQSGLKIFRTGLWQIDHYIEPSDDDERPMDLLQAVAIAEIERALAEDYYFDASSTFAGAGGFAGVGYNAELRTPQMLNDADGATAGVRVTLAVTYAHTDRDPYTPTP